MINVQRYLISAVAVGLWIDSLRSGRKQSRLAFVMSKAAHDQAGYCTSSSLQLFKQNLFWFTLAAMFDVTLRVWDSGKDQRQQGSFLSL